MSQIKPPDSASTPANPLFDDWTGPDGVPPFDRIVPEHFRPAYARALAEHEAEIAAIAANSEPPSFANTIAALELSGRALQRIGNVFHLLVGADSNDALLEIEREMSPRIARHWNKINTNEALFRRIDTLMRGAEKLGLSAEQKRVLERYHTGFRRAGAALDSAAKQRLAAIIERLAALGTAFSQNVLADEQAFTLRLEGEAELVEHMVAHRRRDADAAQLGDIFKPRRDVDAVAIDVVAIDNDIADIDPHAKFDAPIGDNLLIANGHAALHIDGTTHRIDDRGELDQHAVAGGLDDAAAMLLYLGIDQLTAMGFEAGKGALLIGRHQPRIAADVSRKDGCQFAFDLIPHARATPAMCLLRIIGIILNRRQGGWK